MRRSLVAPVAIIGMLLALVGAAVAAVMLVVATPDLEPPGAGAGVSPGPAGSLPSPTPVAGTGAVTAPEKNPDEDEEGFEERLAAGRALPLKIGQATRDKLVAASRAAAGPSAKSAGVADGGVVYYGVVYGESEATDSYYVVASLDGLHFWTREGRGDWRFRGDYDARVCAPPVPISLYAAWGLNFSTRAPGEYELCRR
ncbi:hypothetical protein [Streptosporangium lutulentum]|uniref:Secreted protein n=1 Tax=Streptosporangium lutulentum TaxID=1461250 RepID=A0ABT9QKZ5_9ACTN|nr:hypothetical protein [Streptosporangium lutulentum]MDP9847425.1 hypothetical protein [Streptosporangium lutulentum]